MSFASARIATIQRRLAASVVVPAAVNATATATTTSTITTTGTRWRVRLGVSD